MPTELWANLGSAWLLGLSLGLTACTATCLPFIGTLVLGKAEGRASGLRDAGLFLAGRWLAYSLLGGLAGACGAWFVQQLASGWGNAAIGAGALLAAASLLRRSPSHPSANCQRRQTASTSAWATLWLGFSLTLIPCAPLISLLATAATSDATGGALLGLAFGGGALLTPMLVLIPATASLAQALGREQPWLLPWLRHLAALVLLSIGCRRLALLDFRLALLTAGLALALYAFYFWRQARPPVRTLLQPLRRL